MKALLAVLVILVCSPLAACGWLVMYALNGAGDATEWAAALFVGIYEHIASV